MKRLLACLGTALVLAGCSSSGSDADFPIQELFHEVAFFGVVVVLCLAGGL